MIILGLQIKGKVLKVHFVESRGCLIGAWENLRELSQAIQPFDANVQKLTVRHSAEY